MIKLITPTLSTGSGKIEEDDFMKVMSDYLDSEKEETLDVRDLFDFFDSDKDGFISQQELQVLLKLCRYQQPCNARRAGFKCLKTESFILNSSPIHMSTTMNYSFEMYVMGNSLLMRN